MPRLEKTIEYLFYLLVFLLPCQTRLIWREATLNSDIWEYGRLSLYGTELLLMLIIFLFAFWLFKTKPVTSWGFSSFYKKLKHPGGRIVLLMALFAIWSGLSVFWAADLELADIRWVQLTEAICLAILVLHFNFPLTKIAGAWIAGAMLQSLLASWQFFDQYAFANKWLGLAEHFSYGGGSTVLQTTDGRWLRAYGSLPHPNMLGGFLLLGLIFLAYYALKAQSQKQRIFALAGLVLIVPAFFFTFSRSAWLAFFTVFALMAFWLWFQKNSAWNRAFVKMAGLTVLLLVILTGLFYNLLFSRFTVQTDLEAQSIALRLTFTKQALTLIQKDPVLGQGLGNYTLGVYQKYNSTWPGYYYQPVHNIYLLAPAELGLIGGVIFWLIIIFSAWFLFNQGRLEKLVLFLGWSAILLIGLFDHYFWTLYSSSVIFWLILGLNLKYLSDEKTG